MAVIIRTVWRGVTEGQYERVRRRVGWERKPPPGGLCHIVWFTSEALHIVDVWEAAEDFRRFARERLTPVVAGELGFAGEPELIIDTAHAVFMPTHTAGGQIRAGSFALCGPAR
jgi:hypothetical protein